MNKAEAKRRVCEGAAEILTANGSVNAWLWENLDEADARRMISAFEDLIAELRRRSEKSSRSA